MRRIDQAELRRDIDISLRILPDRIKRDLTAKLALTRDAATRAVAEFVIEKAIPARYLVVAPDLVAVGHASPVQGTFGVTEPFPFTDLETEGEAQGSAQLTLPGC